MIKLVTDSTCCVDKEFAKKHNISVVNLTCSIDNFSMEEGFEENWEEFYNKLKSSKNFPKTSQPTPSAFENVFKETFAQNPNADIIVITISQSLSGTYNSAKLASQINPEKIYVIDSGQTAQSELLFLEEVVELINQGKTAKEIYDMQEELRKRVCIEFVPQTLEYLFRGGRINLLKATIANVLNIKPILSFKNGVLTNSKKCLGMQKAIIDLINNVPKNFKKLYVCYIHEAGEWLNKLINKVNQNFNLNITEAKNIGPVVGSHIGIGAIGLAYIV